MLRSNLCDYANSYIPVDDDHRGARTHTPNIGTTGW